MKLVVFGLTVSSSWGNGHATLWRGLIRALGRRGWEVTFFERDTPFYAAHRDLSELPFGRLVLYRDFEEIRALARAQVGEADAAMVTSYCPDGPAAAELVNGAARLRLFYDMDTPVTLARLGAGERVDYLPRHGLGDFDLVLSFTGGGALAALERDLGARRAAPLYGHVDPDAHRPAPPEARFDADLSYLGTYAPDRQPVLDELFFEVAARRPDLRFVLGGAGYGDHTPWRPNIHLHKHVPPPDHPAFFSSSRLTLNVTRKDMAAMGWAPSGRLFEAAACGAPVLSDAWEGLDEFFTPGSEVLIARTPHDALEALNRADLAAVGRAARERALDEHTSAHRAAELERLMNAAVAPAALERA